MKLKDYLARFERLDPESEIVYRESKGYKSRNKKLALKPPDDKILIREVYVFKNAKRSYFEEIEDSDKSKNKVKVILLPQFDINDL